MALKMHSWRKYLPLFSCFTRPWIPFFCYSSNNLCSAWRISAIFMKYENIDQKFEIAAFFVNLQFRVWSCLEKWVEFWAPKNLQNPCQIFNRTSALKSKSHFSEKSIFLFFVYFLFIFSQVTRKTKPEIKRELQD